MTADGGSSADLVFARSSFMGRTTTASDLNQGALFDLLPASTETASAQTLDEDGARRTFVEPGPNNVFIGAMRLRVYLEHCGELGALRLADALRMLDWKDLEAKYSGPGRAPYAPRLMAGLVIYGLLKGVSSLRGLESLSRVDLGCLWICEGIQPDHSNIGRFILRHQEQFEGTFFEQVTRLALRATNSGVDAVAGDGTVIQAAASRYRTLKREALDRKLDVASKEAEEQPDSQQNVERKAKYAAADAALKSREDKRESKGKPTDSLRVSTTEPEATIQPLKNKSFAPSYKPSVLANKARVIVGQAVDPSDEISVVGAMLDQAASVGAHPVERLMLDGNYCNETILNEALARDIDLLCPESGETQQERSKLAKSDFTYDETRDTYKCPGGHELTPRSRAKNGEYVQYETSGCAGCPLRDRCFSAKSTRRVIRRLAVDEAKDALRCVMEQPQARVAYTQRKAMVEPVFSFLSGVMNLRRFRRKGLSKVRLEFSLYVAAYNLGRVLAAQSVFSRLHSLFGLICGMVRVGREFIRSRRLRLQNWTHGSACAA